MEVAMSLPLAHVAHWAVYVLYAVPVVVVLTSVVVTTVREHRAGATRSPEP